MNITDLPDVLVLVGRDHHPTCPTCHYTGDAAIPATDVDLLPFHHDPAGCAALEEERLLLLDDLACAPDDGTPMRRVFDGVEADLLPYLMLTADEDFGGVSVIVADGRRRRIFTVAVGEDQEQVAW